MGAEYVVKLMKCGGVTPALSIARIAEVGGRGLMWGCMDESAISIARLLSYGLWVATAWQVTPRLRLAFIVAILVFVGHVFEEYLTHLHLALPALFGRAPWSDPQFLVFNGVWALVFCAAAVTLSPVRSIPVFIILFFAVAGQVIDERAKTTRRRFAHETKAQEFAMYGCRRLWSGPIDHVDPVHNPPGTEELAALGDG